MGPGKRETVSSGWPVEWSKFVSLWLSTWNPHTHTRTHAHIHSLHQETVQNFSIICLVPLAGSSPSQFHQPDSLSSERRYGFQRLANRTSQIPCTCTAHITTNSSFNKKGFCERDHRNRALRDDNSSSVEKANHLATLNRKQRLHWSWKTQLQTFSRLSNLPCTEMLWSCQGRMLLSGSLWFRERRIGSPTSTSNSRTFPVTLCGNFRKYWFRMCLSYTLMDFQCLLPVHGNGTLDTVLTGNKSCTQVQFYALKSVGVLHICSRGISYGFKSGDMSTPSRVPTIPFLSMWPWLVLENSGGFWFVRFSLRHHFAPDQIWHLGRHRMHPTAQHVHTHVHVPCFVMEFFWH